MKKTENILILGIGNDILTDDGIGPRLVLDLAQMIVNPGIRFDVTCCGGLEIMEYIKGYDKVVFIDAIRTINGKPGDVYNFKLSEFRETSHLSNLHDINFLTAVRLGKNLDLNLPSDLHIIAIEIIEDLEFSEDLSMPVKKQYPKILEKVYSVVKEITG